jgi:hypothetical protein
MEDLLRPFRRICVATAALRLRLEEFGARQLPLPSLATEQQRYSVL